MPTIRTNRDLYVAVADLIGKHRSTARTLEEYLRALWQACRGFRDRAALTADEFLELLAGGFSLSAPPFDETWQNRCEEDRGQVPGFAGWEARILRQVVDLHEMAERGLLDNEWRYFGINSPSGQRWYNFDPCTFLECATEGTYGGWQPGDDTGRDFVPGEVAVLGEDGKLTGRDPRELARPTVSILEVSWDGFRDFLGHGQWYE